MRGSLIAKSVFGTVAGAFVVVALGACSGKPLDKEQQWVARDAWDATCAEKATVEKWTATNERWEIKDSVYVVDVDATFRMINDCDSGLPLVGKKYKTIEVVPFKGTVKMSKCKKDNASGWALPGKEGSRCWTGPNLLAK